MSSTLLENRLALVTGAGGEIGRAISKLLSTEGARIVAVDINEDNAKETVNLCNGGNHAYFKLDVSSSESVRSVVKNIVETLGVPTIVVNCAGIAPQVGFLDISEELYDRMLNTHLKGSFMITQEVCKVMKAKGLTNGSIINISSIAAKIAIEGIDHYGMAKAGILALTRSTAREMAPLNVRCNAICPGPVDTQLLQNAFPNTVHTLIDTIALRRLGRPEEIAETCLFLASDKASFITGAAIDVNGGMGI